MPVYNDKYISGKLRKAEAMAPGELSSYLSICVRLNQKKIKKIKFNNSNVVRQGLLRKPLQ